MNNSNRVSLPLAIGLITISIIIIAIYSFRQIRQFNSVSARISHTQSVLLALNNLNDGVMEHAGYVRNFSFSGNKAIIADITRTMDSLVVRKKIVQDLIPIRGQQRMAFDSLDYYISKRISFSGKLINTGNALGHDSVYALYQTGIGREYNNHILSICQQMDLQELNLLKLDENQNIGSIGKLSGYLAGLFLFVLALILLVIRGLRIEIKTRQENEERLEHFNTELEEQVALKTKNIRLSEERLEASEKKLRQVLASTADNFYVIDRSYHVTLINEAARKNLEKAWGMPVMLGTRISDHFPIETQEPIRQSFERVFTGEKISYELELHREGLPAWILVNYMPVIDENGIITGASVMTNDISSRKKAEKEKDRVRYLLDQRVNELTTLYRVGQILQEEGLSLPTVLYSIANFLPSGWQYPEITVARISLDDQQYMSAPLHKSVSRMAASFTGPSGTMGEIEIIYQEEKPQEKEGPFLEEERNLVNMLAEMLTNYFSRHVNSEKLRESYNQIRQLASHIEAVREEEKIKISREIHDELGQQLTGLKMDIAWLAKQKAIKENNLTDKTSEIIALIDDTVKTVRKIATELRPGVLDDLGLTAAMQWQSREFEKRSGIRSVFKSIDSGNAVPSTVTTALFRVFQESLTNVARHANATEVTTVLELLSHEIILRIKDNGKGFDPGQESRTLGLLGMRERIMSIGGEFQISSQPGTGTQVNVRIGEYQ